MITVKRPSGLVVPFDPPKLTREAAIERSWEVPDGGQLLEPKHEYLPAYPCPPWGFAPARIPWHDEYDYAGMIAGLFR